MENEDTKKMQGCGQTLVRETGCITVLSELFRTVLSKHELNLLDNKVFQNYQLWSSVCSALCACVNNPQNAYVQKYFVSVGGLEVLSQVLVHLESDSYKIVSNAKLAVVVTKTMDACIADNQENQYDLFKNNGLPLMIQALTDSQNEELHKAATFVLHNCRKTTEKLSLNVRGYSFDENEAKQLKDTNAKEKNLEEYWKTAKEILRKIEQLEREDNEEEIQRRSYENPFMNKENILKHLYSGSTGDTKAEEDKNKNQPGQFQTSPSGDVTSKACATDNRVKTLLKSTHPFSGQKMTLRKVSSSCNQGLHEKTTFDKKNFVYKSSDRVFKYPIHVVRNKKQHSPVTDPFTLCSDIINKEVLSFQAADSCTKILKYRCSGCISVGNPLNSRNFSKLLRACPYQCDRHKVIVEAEDRYKSELRKSFICNKKILLTPCRRQQLSSKSAIPGEINEHI
ncbi:PREDICTED: telomere repeats-binding bouquet formation protein 1 [Dipodomys ordii]|uniref:Telomere repeats-binding bouquet formation protein 1 n=1 Tax=Dipodomys ordii TaxID=10020 RepID=A0A1S3EUM1_DIPOR|nr:PREDICTED: telomere repeats-binding bouquet formation protein 1 [Dipodomys ordii]